METQIMRVTKVGDLETYTSNKAEVGTIEKRNVVLQGVGGKYEDSYAVALFGLSARQPLAVGDIVAAKLSYLTHDYQNQTYQDVIAREVVKLAKA
jgi:hypothetical protein